MKLLEAARLLVPLQMGVVWGGERSKEEGLAGGKNCLLLKKHLALSSCRQIFRYLTHLTNRLVLK